MIFTKKLEQKVKDLESKVENFKSSKIRSFLAAQNSRLTNWISSFQKVDADLKSDYIAMVLRARDLAKNNDFVSSFLQVQIRNVIGENGFRLQVNSDEVDSNIFIEKNWLEYGKKENGFLSLDEKTSMRDFDIQVLTTFLIDGEVFIRKHIDETSKYKVRYEIIDSLLVDARYNVNDCGSGEKIVMGIKKDRKGRVKSYFVNEASNDYYTIGNRVEVDASEIIHLYRPLFTSQTRGYTLLASAILNLAQLDDYKQAEIIAARMNACNQAFYVKTGVSGDNPFDDSSVDASGSFTQEYTPGMIRFAPEGYTVQQIQNSHPHSGFGVFLKNVLRSAASSVGLSYNKATSDYDSVSYSSLREAALEDRAGWKELQKFFIENWKNLQYCEFLNFLVLENDKILKFKKMENYKNFKFFGRTWEWVDPQKDLSAIKLKLELKLTDPITEIEATGREADEVLDRWELWNKKLSERNLSNISVDEISEILVDETEEEEKIQVANE